MPVYVCLLRAVNLGARNKVPMPALREALAADGFRDVATYVQSGNVVLRARGSAASVARAVEQAIAREFGHAITVIVRTPTELRQVVERNPFPDEADPTKVLVVFLEKAPATRNTELNEDRSPPDRFVLRGRDIYLHVPNGFGRSKLTIDYFERRLGVKGTIRNWRSVTKLLELAEAR